MTRGRERDSRSGDPPSPPSAGSGSMSRGRSHHSSSTHRHRHARRRSRFRFKRKESNFVAAVCSMIVMVLLCTALAEPHWFYFRGGGCMDADRPGHYLGVNQFFYVGRFLETTSPATSKDHPTKNTEAIVYNYGKTTEELLVNCVTPRVVEVLRSIIALCFIGISFSLVAFLMDLSGPTHSVLKFFRRNAVFSIFTVVICVTINGFCYWVTELVQTLQILTKAHSGSKVEVQFSVSFYLVAAAGGVSVISVACNLLRRHVPTSDHTDYRDRENLLDDYDGMDIGPQFGGPPGSDPSGPMSSMAAPPAYTP